MAAILYKKGVLEGKSLYYHPSGAVWKEVHFENDLAHGQQKIFLEEGTLLQVVEYMSGMRHGTALRYWNPLQIAYQEKYEQDKLLEAYYYSIKGELLTTIVNGKGSRALFGKESLQELQEYKNGVQEGMVKTFDATGNLLSTHFIKNQQKEGEEIHYFLGTCQPKLSLQWKNGFLQGVIKTWHENGIPESQKEMSENQKNGLFTAWYPNGDLMLVEEYDKDTLMTGVYYRIGEKSPLSKIEKGNGLATLFDKEGNLLHKIVYESGKPHE